MVLSERKTQTHNVVTIKPNPWFMKLRYACCCLIKECMREGANVANAPSSRAEETEN
jgi:hypothetical protein